MTKVQVAVLATAIAGAGCGGGVSEDAQELFEELCDTAFRCCTQGEIDGLLGPFFSRDNCAERLEQFARTNPSSSLGLLSFALPIEGAGFVIPHLEVLEAAVEAGRSSFVTEAVEDCVRAIRELPCNDGIPEPEMEGCVPREPEIPEPCDLDLLVRGNVGPGGDCTSPGLSFECQEGFNCVQSNSFGDGVCIEPSGVGDFCITSSECGEDLFCNILDGLCEPLRGLDEPCEFVNPDDLTPSPSELLTPCEEHLTCDPVSDTCVPDCVQGAPCTVDDDCQPDTGLVCIFTIAGGRCDFIRSVDQPCSGDDNCAEGSFCGLNPANPTELICLELLDNGEVCDRDVQCGSGYCADNLTGADTCEAQVADGMPCPSRDNAQCMSGFCEIRTVLEINQADPTPIGQCFDDIDCPGASTCDLNRNRCVELCRAKAADNTACGLDAECLSGSCVGAFFGSPGECQVLPLADGKSCSGDFQCESEFCNRISNVCQSLPLANGEPCLSDTECASEVCDATQCVQGLTEGADCSVERCGRGLFCDSTTSPPLCQPKLEPGQLCTSNAQCEGLCRVLFGRLRCDLTPPSDAEVCDGGDSPDALAAE